MRLSWDGWGPPSGAGGMPGGMSGGSQTPERSKPGAGREAVELASEAARAEGASNSGEPRGGRADHSGTAATTLRAGGVELAPGAHQAKQAGPFLRMGGDQQPHSGSASPASQPGRGPLAGL